MSHLVAYTIICDVCNVMGTDEEFPTLKEVRAYAKKKGWRSKTRDGLRVDACPGCVSKAIAEPREQPKG
jgi:hypothetical protein